MPVARPIPQPVRKPAAPADPFGDLPDFGSAPAYGNAPAGNAGFGFPPAQPPARPMTPNYRTGPAPAAPKRKKASGGGNQLVKILGIIGGVGVLCVLLCAGGIFGLAYLGTRHSGWTTEQFQGYTIDMPAGKDRKTQSQQRPLTTIHELSARRKETGSQYSLLVAKVPGGGANMSVEDMIRSMQLLVFDDRSITRDGVRGVAGKMAGSSQGAQASEAEIFLHNGNLVVAMYSAYSKIQFAVGGTRDPRKNERDLDKPDEFFASLQFQ